MKIHRIINQNDKWYKEFHSFYTVSFPIHEQRNEIQQTEAFADGRYHLDCYIEDNRLQAFVAYWDFQTYSYIEHLAVHPDLRGQSVGTKILSQFINAASSLVLLEIDPVIDEVSAKRFRFYQHLGFIENPYPHYHPAYDKRFEPHHLTVLTYPRVISQDEYNRFYDDLSNVVMS